MFRVSKAQFENLYRQHEERLTQSMTALVRDRDGARDVAAAAFATAFEKFDTFRGESSFYTWLEAIARHKVIESRRCRPAISLDALEFEPASLIECEIAGQALERSADCDQMQKTLREIPTIYRETLMDHLVRGRSVKQMARLHRVPQGTILSRLFTARQKLRAAWLRMGSESGLPPMLT